MKLTCSFLKDSKIRSDLLVLITRADLPIKFDYLSEILNLNLNSILAKLNLSEKGSDTFISLEDREISSLLFIRITNLDIDPVEKFREVGYSIQRSLKQVKGKKVHIVFSNIETDLVQDYPGSD